MDMKNKSNRGGARPNAGRRVTGRAVYILVPLKKDEKEAILKLTNIIAIADHLREHYLKNENCKSS